MDAEREFLLSDITEMRPGYCVLGIEPAGGGQWRTVRPLPGRSMAWPDPFPYKRRECVLAALFPFETDPPHFEDRTTAGLAATGRFVPESDLVGCLHRAEMAASIEGLFGAPPQPSPHGGPAVWVKPSDAVRSVCGCVPCDIRFQIYMHEKETRLRARLSLPSGEMLPSLPIVDHDWNRLVRHVLQASKAADPAEDLRRKLNGPVRARLMESKFRLARIGLTRPWSDGMCWLMLDSLFPQPKVSWLKSDFDLA